MAPPIRRNQRSSHRWTPAPIPLTGIAVGLFAAIAAGFAASRSLKKKAPPQSQAQPAHSESQLSESQPSEGAQVFKGLEELDKGSTDVSVKSEKEDYNAFQEDEGTQANQHEDGTFDFSELVQGLKDVNALCTTTCCNTDGSVSECSLREVNSSAVKPFLWPDLKQECVSPEKMKSWSASEAGSCDGDFATHVNISSPTPKPDSNGLRTLGIGQSHSKSPILEARGEKPEHDDCNHCGIDQSYPEKNISDDNHQASKKSCQEFAELVGNIERSLFDCDFDDVAHSDFKPDGEFSIDDADKEVPMDSPDKEFSPDVPNSAVLSDVKSILAGNDERLLSADDIAVSGLDSLISVGEAILASVAADKGKNKFVEEKPSSSKHKDVITDDENPVDVNLNSRNGVQAHLPTNANKCSEDNDVNSFNEGFMHYQQYVKVCNTCPNERVSDLSTATSSLRISTDAQIVFDAVQNSKGEKQAFNLFDISKNSTDSENVRDCSFSDEDSDHKVTPGTAASMVSNTNFNSMEVCDPSHIYGVTSPLDQNVECDNEAHPEQSEPSGFTDYKDNGLHNDQVNLEGVDDHFLSIAAELACQSGESESSDVASCDDAESNLESEIVIEDFRDSRNGRSEPLREHNYSELCPDGEIVVETISNSGNGNRKPSKEVCIGDDSESNPETELDTEEINYSSKTFELSKEESKDVDDTESNPQSEVDVEEINISNNQLNGPSKEEFEDLDCRFGYNISLQDSDKTITGVNASVEDSQAALGSIIDPSCSSGIEGRTSLYILDGIHDNVRTMQDVNGRQDSKTSVNGMDGDGTINSGGALNLNSMWISRSCSIESSSFPIQEILKNFDIRDDISIGNDDESNAEGMPGTLEEDALSKYEPFNYSASNVEGALSKVDGDASSSGVDDQLSDGSVENNEGDNFTSCAELGLFLVQDLCSGYVSGSSGGCNIECENHCIDLSATATHHVLCPTDGSSPESENGSSESGYKLLETRQMSDRNTNVAEGSISSSDEAYLSGSISVSGIQGTDNSESGIQNCENLDSEEYCIRSPNNLEVEESGIQMTENQDYTESGIYDSKKMDLEESGVESTENLALEELDIWRTDNPDLEWIRVNESGDSDLVNDMSESHGLSINAVPNGSSLKADYSLPATTCLCCCTSTNGVMHNIGSQIDTKPCLDDSDSASMYGYPDEEEMTGIDDAHWEENVLSLSEVHGHQENRYAVQDKKRSLAGCSMQQEDGIPSIVGETSSVVDVSSSVESPMYQKDGEAAVISGTHDVVCPQEIPERSELEHQNKTSPVDDESSVYVEERHKDSSFSAHDKSDLTDFAYVPANFTITYHTQDGEHNKCCFDDEVGHIEEREVKVKDFDTCSSLGAGQLEENESFYYIEMKSVAAHEECNQVDSGPSTVREVEVSALVDNDEKLINNDFTIDVGTNVEFRAGSPSSRNDVGADAIRLSNVIELPESTSIYSTGSNEPSVEDSCHFIVSSRKSAGIPSISRDSTLHHNLVRTEDLLAEHETLADAEGNLNLTNETLLDNLIIRVEDKPYEHGSLVESEPMLNLTSETLPENLVRVEDKSSEHESLADSEPMLNLTSEALQVNKLMGQGEQSSVEIAGDESIKNVGSELNINTLPIQLVVDEQSTDTVSCSGNLSGDESMENVESESNINTPPIQPVVDEQSTDTVSCSGNLPIQLAADAKSSEHESRQVNELMGQNEQSCIEIATDKSMLDFDSELKDNTHLIQSAVDEQSTNMVSCSGNQTIPLALDVQFTDAASCSGKEELHAPVSCSVKQPITLAVDEQPTDSHSCCGNKEQSSDATSCSGNEELHLPVSGSVNLQIPLTVDEQSTGSNSCSGIVEPNAPETELQHSEKVDDKKIREFVNTITAKQRRKKNKEKFKHCDWDEKQNISQIDSIPTIDSHFKPSEQSSERGSSGQTTPVLLHCGEDINKLEEPRVLMIAAGLKACEDPVKEDVSKPTECNKKRRRRQKKRVCDDTVSKASIVKHDSQDDLLDSSTVESELISKTRWLYKVQKAAPYLHLEIGILCLLILLLSFTISYLGMSQPP